MGSMQSFIRGFGTFVERNTHEVLNALNTGVIPEGWNDTTMVLTPKTDDPEMITQF
jgi:hypothetical protein